jgi:hypothetical protein
VSPYAINMGRKLALGSSGSQLANSTGSPRLETCALLLFSFLQKALTIMQKKHLSIWHAVRA